MAKAYSAQLFKSAICRTNCIPRPNPTLLFFPGLDNRHSVIPNSMFPDITKSLQSNYDVILQEFLNLKSIGANNDYDVGDHKLHEGDWKWHSCKKFNW